MTQELKPCPFCGNKDTIEPMRDGPKNYVMCYRCGAVAQSAEAWNRRSPEPSAGDAEALPTDELERIIDSYVADYETLYDEGFYKPNDDEQFRIKDVIMGLLADPEWDEAWGRHNAALRAASAPAVPQELHPRTADLVDRFAIALKEKLTAAEKKYGYSDKWAKPDWMDECRAQLLHHIEKGDPRDVAAYCAFLWHHGESTR